jgi:hypothetical protein
MFSAPPHHPCFRVEGTDILPVTHFCAMNAAEPPFRGFCGARVISIFVAVSYISPTPRSFWLMLCDANSNVVGGGGDWGNALKSVPGDVTFLKLRSPVTADLFFGGSGLFHIKGTLSANRNNLRPISALYKQFT